MFTGEASCMRQDEKNCIRKQETSALLRVEELEG